MPRTRHEPAPALAVLMLDQMRSYTSWDMDPELYVVYADRFGKVPLPPVARADHPRVMLHRMAAAFEASSAPWAPVKPRDMVGVAMMFEFWAIAGMSEAEREVWRRRNFAEHPRAYESRLLIVEQPGHPPVFAVHNRDTKGTGQELPFLEPGIAEGDLVPGQASPPLLHNLHRVMVAMCAPPATFRGR